MTWQEKFAALSVLCDTCLRMRKPGDWYVSAIGREMKTSGSSALVSCYGNGTTPEETVENDWSCVAEPKDGARVVLHAMDPEKRRQVRWNGYMWEDVP